MIHRGEIYLIDLSGSMGSEQNGVRPAVVVQNEVGNQFSPTTIVVPLTSRSKQATPTHISLTPEDCGIVKESIVLCEQVRTVDKARLKRKLGEVKNKQKLADINNRIAISLGLCQAGT